MPAWHCAYWAISSAAVLSHLTQHISVALLLSLLSESAASKPKAVHQAALIMHASRQQVQSTITEP